MRVIQLESRLTSLGRDPSKDIAIECDLISREHATFLRVPSLDPDKYEYRIIDGGPSKNRSKNGISKVLTYTDWNMVTSLALAVQLKVFIWKLTWIQRS